MHAYDASVESHAREREILVFVAKLLDLDKLDTLLHEVVRETPQLINNRGCSIYLNPKFVRSYDGNLVEHGQDVNEEEIKKRIIVLAAASPHRNLSEMIGKYFYRPGEGLTGWVFRNKRALFLDDMSDKNELSKYPSLEWVDKYGGATSHYGRDSSSRKPFLAVPIMVKNRCEGVIRVSTPPDGQCFPDWAKNMFLSFGRVISKRIEIESIIYEQQGSLGRLIRIINRFGRREESRAFSAIVDEAKNLIGGLVCNLYILDQHGMTVRGEATTDPVIRSERQRDPNKAKSFYRILPGPFSRKPRQGLTGWIFRTGKPLVLENISAFEVEQHLEDERLCAISNSALINEEDRAIQARKDEVSAFGGSSRFLGVPLLTGSGKAQGVITIVAPEDHRPYRKHRLRLLQGFARHVSILLTNMKRRKVTDLLINIGQKYGDDLFRYVVKEIPELIYARGCSIFEKPMEKDRSDDSQETDSIRLMFTSSPDLLMTDGGGIKPVVYRLGEGKTGFVAKVGRTLVINHYGAGNLDRSNLEKDFKKYREHPAYKGFNLVRCLKDDHGREVGIARLIRSHNDDPCDEDIAREFKGFVNRIRFTDNGLQSNKEKCEDAYAWSFLASPLKDTQGHIYGVMRMPRGFPGGIFTDEDVALAMSITNRLCSVMEKVRTLERNLMILDGINSKINASFNSDNPMDILQSILEAVTDNLGFEFATIQLVDQERKYITTVLTRRNAAVPGAWNPQDLVGTSHLLDPDGDLRDIHAYVLREYRRPYIPKENDIHFDPTIFKKYHHEKLIRVFVPIIAQNPETEIGTIETGYDITRQAVIEDGLVVMLQALANQAAIAIRNQNLKQELIRTERLKILPEHMHIINSPVSRLYMRLDGIGKELAMPEIDLDQIRQDVEQSKRLGQMIKVMSLTFSGLMASESKEQRQEEVDLTKLLNEQVHEFGHYSEHIETRNELSRSVLLPLTDSERLRVKIIMFNLLLNAVKYSPPGGLVRIATFTEDGRLTISVEDEGPGFSPHYLASGLGQPAPSRRHGDWPYGTGLGLYQTCRMIEELGWKYDACNGHERGAIFNIRIPESRRTRDGTKL